MSRRLIMNIALAVAGAFGLAVAVPSLACECDKNKAEKVEKAEKKGDTKAAPAQKSEKPAADKKAEAATSSGLLLAAGCNCGAKEAKDCKCGKDCKCYEQHGKEKPKASAATGSTILLAAGCNCTKDGKNCTCPKGECKCENCKQAQPKAKAA